jgi:hypothetical protein
MRGCGVSGGKAKAFSIAPAANRLYGLCGKLLIRVHLSFGSCECKCGIRADIVERGATDFYE